MNEQRKPDKPYPEFPLYAHPSGQWAKTIKGRKWYFGPWNKPEQALDEYLSVKDEIFAGRNPNAIARRGEPDVRELLNLFCTEKEDEVDAGVILRSTFQEYFRTCSRVADCLGKNVLLRNLGPMDFSRLRNSFSKLAVTTQKNEVARCRVLFGFAYESGLVDKPLRYKKSLKAPPMRAMRKAANERNKLIPTPDLLKIIKNATGTMKVAILLGINCGMGNRDVALIERKHIDMSGGWINYPRSKTGVDRRAKLWPETVAAIAELPPRVGRLLVGDRGQSLAQDGNTTIGNRWRVVCNRAKVFDFGFYCLRHTYRTLADECGDQPAIAKTMGHSIASIDSVYRHRISDERLKKIADFVHDAVFKSASAKAEYSA